MPATATAVHRQRADACRNRERIVTAARDAFAECGADVPLDVIARRAGVGNATLYRNFTDRRRLARQVVLSVTARLLAHAAAAAVEEPDAFAALCRFTHAAADERIGVLCPLISAHVDPADPEVAAARAALAPAVTGLLDRARGEGRLRPDVGAGDYLLALGRLTRPFPGTRPGAADPLLHRQVQLLLDGLRTPAHSPLPGRAAGLAELQGHC